MAAPSSSRSLSVVIAPDSFKGTASAADAASALAEGWRSVRPADTLRLLPMADGGEGTLDAFEMAIAGARRMPVTVHGPLGEPVKAEWLLLPAGAGEPGDPAAGTTAGSTAVVELAVCSGITLIDELAPLDAHTLGFGEVIAAALDQGVDRLLLALGGSCSTDAGAGALAALGARFTDATGRPLRLGNRGLAVIARADLSTLRPLPAGGVAVLSDVTNPLLGQAGAAAVFGPQKGAGADTIIGMEQSLARFARLFDGTPGAARTGGHTVDPATSGAGAAGGTAFGLLTWGATLAPGAAAVANALGLPEALVGADIVITGEGRFDGQSAAGKVPSHVAALAREHGGGGSGASGSGRGAAGHGARVALVAGAIDADASEFAASIALTDLAGSPAAAMAETLHWLRAAGARLAAEFSQ